MARMHAHTHGKSHSSRPTSKDLPLWLTESQGKVSSLIVTLSREGLTPSEIGLRLRDENGIPLTKPVLGKSITDVLV